MSKPSFLTDTLGRKSLSIVVSSILFLITLASQAAPSSESGGTDRQEVFRRLVQSYVQAGKEEYDKGYFEQAVKTFQMAEGYQEYLTPAGREQLGTLTKKAQTAVVEKKRALETFATVNKLIKQNQLTEARTPLEGLSTNEFLTKDERAQITEVLKQIDTQIAADKAHTETVEDHKLAAAQKLEKIAEQIRTPADRQNDQSKRIAELYRDSMRLYRSGQFEEARKGLAEVAASSLIPPAMKKTIEGYIAEIDKVAPMKADKTAASQENKPEMTAVIEPKGVTPQVPAPELASPKLTESAEQKPSEELVAPQVVAAPAAAEPSTGQPRTVTSSAASPGAGEGSYIDQITRRRNIVRSHTEAVVNDAIAKARGQMGEGQFDKARQTVATAQFTVNENQVDLGDELYKTHSGRLQALSEEIVQKQSQMTQQSEQDKRVAATEAQRRFREQMETDRQKRIAELMENAKEYQKQQKYEASLAQLKSLLILDPQNDEALRLKDTLEDTVNFRRQLEVERESNRQRAEILLGTEESQIPYADELTYPKNWREIVQKPTRQPDKPIGLDPVDANVYERLEQVVDLPNLTPATSFSEAINQLKAVVTPPLQIQPNWKDLLDLGEVEPTTPSGMDPLTGVKLRKALDLLVAGVSTDIAPLNWIVDEGVIRIATATTLPDKMVPRVYDITDLVGEPAQYGGMQGMMMGQMMGMMGGGMGGYGGGMGGGMGGSGVGQFIAQDLTYLIQDATGWESWADTSETGEGGTVTPYPSQQPKKLAVLATHEVHAQIENLLVALRKALGYQVSIEARFLVVSENFLEDIGLDVDFSVNLGTNWGQVSFEQDSALISKAEPTQVPLSLGGIGASASVSGGYGSILDDLQVAFLLRATQAHRDSKALTAPIASVLSGESASFNISRIFYLALPPIQGGGVTTTGAATGTTTNTGTTNVPQYMPITSGSTLSITPIITHDKKNVLLGIITRQQDFLGIRASKLEYPSVTGTGTTEVVTYDVQLPETETSSLMTRVSVPDGGTLLLGGQKITAMVDKEAGVPVLSKIPVLGRLFSNRSTVKDQRILLILVKPTILLQEEREAEAIAALENQL